MFEMEKYDKVKPQPIPFQISAKIRNRWVTGLSNDKFGNRLSEILVKDEAFQKVKQTDSGGLLFESGTRLNAEERAMLETSSSIKATRQIANFQKLLDFIPRAKLAFLEQSGSTINNELVKSETYTDYRFALNSAFWNPKKVLLKQKDTKEDAKKAKFGVFFDEDGHPSEDLGYMEPGLEDYLSEDVYGQIGEELYGEAYGSKLIPAQENLWSHDLNLYHGLSSWNPFKKQAHEHGYFEDSDLLNPLNSGFASPLAAIEKLDSSIWKTANDWLQKIQNVKRLTSNGSLTKFENPNVSPDIDDNDLNWEDAPDVYNDNGEVDTFDINANFYTLAMSEAWRTFNQDESFSFLLMAYESEKRGIKSLRDIVGRVFDLPNMHGLSADEEEEKVAQVVENTKQWWESVGQHLNNNSMMITFGSIPELAHSVATMSDAWNEWGETDLTGATAPISQNLDFKNKMIGDYLSYIKENYIGQLKVNTVIEASDLEGIDGLSGKHLFSSLVENGYLSADGNIGASFSVNNVGFKDGMGLSEEGEEALHSVLKNAALGALGVESLDKMLVGGKERTDIKLIGPDDQTFRLDEVLDFIDLGEGAEEKYEVARYAYNVAFDVFESMSGLHLKSDGSNGKVVGETIGEKFQVMIYPNSSWTEWNPQLDKVLIDDTYADVEEGTEIPEEAYEYVGGWQEVTGDPLYIQFDSEEEAQQTLDHVRALIASLEPVVAGFDPTNAAGPGHATYTYEGGNLTLSNLRVLIDNQGSTEALAFIKPGDSNYRIMVDVLPHYNNEGPVDFPEDEFTAIRGFDRFFHSGGESWGKQINAYLKDKAIQQVAEETFNTSRVNAELRRQSKSKKRKYNEGKEEHKIEQYEKMKAEQRRLADVRQQKRLLEKARLRFKKRMEKLREMQLAKSRAEAAKRKKKS